MTVNPVYTETVYPLAGTNLGPFPTVWPYESQSDVLVWVDLGAGPALQAVNAVHQQMAAMLDSMGSAG